MKFQYFELISTLICLSLVTITVGDELNSNSLKNPELTINWRGPLPFGWVGEDEVIAKAGVTFRGDDIIVTTLASSLLITCSAPYPVYWDYDNSEEMALSASLDSMSGSSIRVNTYRVSEDFNEPSSYIYYAFLRLTDDSRFITSNYTCRSMTNENLRTTRYIFWPGQETDFGIGILPSKSVMADSLNQTITLPCSVSDPTAQVHLFKENPSSKEFDEVKLDNKSVQFDPKIGFILKIQELASAFGKYKCVLKGYVGDSVLLVNALPGAPHDLEIIEKNILNGTANYNIYDVPTFGHTICCFGANSTRLASDHVKSVKLYIQNCRTKSDCKRIRDQMRNVENMRAISSCGRAMTKPGQVFGVFRCIGEDIDVTREYYLPPQVKDFEFFGYTENAVEQKGNLSMKITFAKKYIDGEISKIPPETFVSIKTAGKSSGSTYNVYSKIPVTIQCYPSTYLFTFGVRWSILWENGTTEILPESVSHLFSHPSVLATFLEQEMSSSLELKFDKRMKSITCHAPLLNSTGWVNKTLQLNVTESVPPKIKGPDFEILTWKARDANKFLACESDGLGIPTPVFSWIHPWTGSDHYRYDTTAAKKLKDELKQPEIIGNSSIIRFEIVRPFMTGIYTCVLHSALGEARKLFQVNVTDYLDRLTVATTTASPILVTSPTQPTQASISDRRTLGDSPSSLSPTPVPNHQNSALVTTLIILSVTILFAAFGASCVYIFRRFKQQSKLSVKPQQSILSWNEMANGPNIQYEEFYNL